ncbi:MAG: hypothetical protein ACRDPC_23220 [Solirubrobacteraceae bacterium]
MRRTLPLLACLLALALAPAAHAGWFVAEPLDGPADIERVAVDLGREETGGLVYIKRDGAGSRAWLSIYAAGAFGAPAPFSGPGATEAAVAAGEEGRVAVAWIENGDVLGALAGGAVAGLSSGGGASGVSVDMGVNGVAYAVWTHAGDVRAARLEGQAWQPVPAPLDINPAATASGPRVAVAADGSALVVWTEAGGDGRTHVFARRLYGTNLSSIPQDATLDTFEGQAAGSADSPDVDVEYDRSYAWVVFRQDIGGRSRSIGRRLRASTFEPPQAIDGGVTSIEPRVSTTGLGSGHGVAWGMDGTVIGSSLRDDAFQPPARVDLTGVVSRPLVAFSDRSDAAVVWRAGGDSDAVVRGRLAPDESPFGPEVVLSRGDLGPVAPNELAASSNRVADVAVAMLQGAPGARHLTVAMHDLPPSRPVLSGTRSHGPARPMIRWNPGLDFGGPQTFKVLIDGREVATTAKTRLRAPRKLKRGSRRLQVIGVDRRGQVSPPSRSRRMVIDAGKPRLGVRFRRSGRCVSVSIRTRDRRRGTGIRGVRTDWGDESKRSRRMSARHCYRRGGRYTVTVVSRDRAGNKTTRRRTFRV